jgi:hypothetical protein
VSAIETLAQSGQSAESTTTTFAYDVAGRVTTIDGGAFEGTMTYDWNGNPTSLAPGGQLAHTSTYSARTPPGFAAG